MPQALKIFFLSLTSLVLAACAPLAQLQPLSVVAQEHDPRVGTTLDIAQVMQVPSGQITAWFDPVFNEPTDVSVMNLFGNELQRNGLKCGVRLARPVPLGGDAVQIETGSFTVRRIVRESDPRGIDPATVSRHDGFSSDITLIYRVDLSSAQQPQVAALFCSQRHAVLSRGELYPSAVDLRKQAGDKLLWPEL